MMSDAPGTADEQAKQGCTIAGAGVVSAVICIVVWIIL